MHLINFEINLILTLKLISCYLILTNSVTSSGTGATKFSITNIKRHVTVVSLSTHDNAKLLQQL